MQIELPVIINAAVKNRTYASEHIIEAQPGEPMTVGENQHDTTLIELINGQLRSIDLTYAEYRQRGFEGQYIFTYNEGVIPV